MAAQLKPVEDDFGLSAAPRVYAAIAAVQGELAKVGISKDGVNEQQKYKFRGIDQVYSTMAPMLARHGLCILPRMVERETHERVSVKEWQGTKKETVLIYVTVRAEFDFVSVEDGSKHTICTYGEAMDSGDKATNKAMSAAYKYAAFMAFAIPVEGDPDADLETHEVEPKRAAPVKLAGPITSKTALWAAVRNFDREVRGCGDLEQFEAFISSEETCTLLAQVRRDAEVLWHGGEGLPEEFMPLVELIAKTRTNLTATENEGWQKDYNRAG